MARPVSDITPASLAERISALEAGVSATGPRPAAALLGPTRAAGGVAPPIVVAPATASADEPARREGVPAAVVTPAAHGGRLDVAELRRRWPDVIRAMKEVKPTTSKMFLETEADLDGDEVVVEFDSSRKVFKKMAEEAEVTALLRTAIDTRARMACLGALPTRARGGPPGWGADAAGRAGRDDLDRVFIEGLGAEVVSERPAKD